MTNTSGESPAPRLIDRLSLPFIRFVQLETAGGIVLLVNALIALMWVNSPWGSSYANWWGTYSGVWAGGWSLKMSLGHWVNDGLMALFFFLVGLEIKHEVVDGELKSWRAATLPIMAAVGGMVVPALIYAAFNFGQPTIRGWGIAMATDIAFALGVLMMLGKRVPPQLKLILMALAIVDDMGAVVVIALFYSTGVVWSWLGWGLLAWLFMFGLSRMGVSRLMPYTVLAVCLWYFVLMSGVHATVAGVLAALAIPATARVSLASLMDRAREMLGAPKEETEEYDQEVALYIGEMAAQAQSPLQRAVEYLHPWVAFGVMPIFALANAGVTLSMSSLAGALQSPVGLGVMLGLVVGKQVGIVGFVWIAVRLGMCQLPSGLTMTHVKAMAWMGGIGFTMSLFINNLAFESAVHRDEAKIGIVVASLVAGVGGALAFTFGKGMREGA